MDTENLAHTKWNCKYHIVFAPKFRRQIVYGRIGYKECGINRNLHIVVTEHLSVYSAMTLYLFSCVIPSFAIPILFLYIYLHFEFPYSCSGGFML